MYKVVLSIIAMVFSFLATPNELFALEKKIEIDTSSQMLYAKEDGNVVYQTAISTGLPATPTVTGTYAIYAKLGSTRMTGGSKEYGYYDLPNVPNVMYFHQGYAIHGAYWHNNFGSTASHGCVNAPLDAAAWLYTWAPSGTMVQVY